ELGMLVRRVAVSGLDPATTATVRRIARDPSGTWHLLPDGRLACYVSLDVHRGLTGRITTEAMLRSRRACHGVFVPSVAWCLLHAVAKLYWEGINAYRKGLHQYVDLLSLLAVATAADLDDFLGLLDAHELAVAAYYVLRRLDSAFAWPLPPSLAGRLRAQAVVDADRDPAEVNDYGDMWPKLWGYR
ncbi:MAG TPA: hypothetical protein VFX28_08750, partial [Methylomirabilota bacterium]|nr:hypothetical protein [Methylomirabilota bacterium]